jgi:uncharacterized C2H2 Zn-finger protein
MLCPLCNHLFCDRNALHNHLNKSSKACGIKYRQYPIDSLKRKAVDDAINKQSIRANNRWISTEGYTSECGLCNKLFYDDYTLKSHLQETNTWCAKQYNEYLFLNIIFTDMPGYDTLHVKSIQ